jgi:hypothetical protein
MDATTVVNLAKAVRLDAASIASRVAMLAGGADDAARLADDLVASRVRTQVTTLADDLDLLASPTVQSSVGPTVNVATEARLLLGPLDRSIPFRTPTPEALRGVDRLLGRYVELAQSWADRVT